MTYHLKHDAASSRSLVILTTSMLNVSQLSEETAKENMFSHTFLQGT